MKFMLDGKVYKSAANYNIVIFFFVYNTMLHSVLQSDEPSWLAV